MAIKYFQTQITADNKLNADLLDTTSSTVKTVTDAEKITWGAKYDKPVNGIPSTDLTAAVQTSLGKADTALQEHQSLSAYRTSSAQDTIDATLQTKTDNSLSTTAKTIVGAINEHETDISTLNLNKADRADVHSLINIWDEQWEKGTYNTSTGEKADSVYSIRSVNYIIVSPSTTYYVKTDGNGCVLFYYDSSKQFISYEGKVNETFTTPSNARYIRFRMSSDYGTTYNSDISINYPSTYTGYYPSRLAKVESRVTNRNLLDNPWFTVNQRNVSGSLPNGYSVDRWKAELHGGTISYDSSTHTLTFGTTTNADFLIQPLEPSLMNELNGKTVTLSYIEGGAIRSATFVYSSSASNVPISVSGSNVMGWIGADHQICLRHLSTHTITTVSAIKLELGTVSTLHMDTAPNYTEELIKCQRYYQLVGQGVTAFHGSNGTTFITLKFPIPMRATPSASIITKTISFWGLEQNTGNVTNYNIGQNTIGGGRYNSNGIEYASIAGTTIGLTIGKYYSVSSDFISVSADL